jgi:hypothetical protein
VAEGNDGGAAEDDDEAVDSILGWQLTCCRGKVGDGVTAMKYAIGARKEKRLTSTPTTGTLLIGGRPRRIRQEFKRSKSETFSKRQSAGCSRVPFNNGPVDNATGVGRVGAGTVLVLDGSDRGDIRGVGMAA